MTEKSLDRVSWFDYRVARFQPAVLSDLTPPDVITAFAAANLAGSEMMSAWLAAHLPGHGFGLPSHDSCNSRNPHRRGPRVNLSTAGRGPIRPEVGVSGRQGGRRGVARGLPAARTFRGAFHRSRGWAGNLSDRAPVPRRICRPAAVLSDPTIQWDADESRLRANRVGAHDRAFQLRLSRAGSEAGGADDSRRDQPEHLTAGTNGIRLRRIGAPRAST